MHNPAPCWTLLSGQWELPSQQLILGYEEYFWIRRVPYPWPLSQPQQNHASASFDSLWVQMPALSLGWGQSTANTPLICKKFGKQGDGMPVLKVSLVCLCPREADPASQAACQHHPSLAVLWLQSPAFHGHSLSSFSRCLLQGAKLQLWTSWRMDEHEAASQIIVFLRSGDVRACCHRDRLRDDMLCV